MCKHLEMLKVGSTHCICFLIDYSSTSSATIQIQHAIILHILQAFRPAAILSRWLHIGRFNTNRRTLLASFNLRSPEEWYLSSSKDALRLQATDLIGFTWEKETHNGQRDSKTVQIWSCKRLLKSILPAGLGLVRGKDLVQQHQVHWAAQQGLLKQLASPKPIERPTRLQNLSHPPSSPSPGKRVSLGKSNRKPPLL